MRFRQPQKTWHALFLSAVMISFQWLMTTSVVSICILAWPVGVGANTVIFEDTIQGSTTGTSQGGAFLGDGWHVTGQYDSIYGHIPSTPFDAVEWVFCGLNPDESRPEFKTLFIVDRMGIEPITQALQEISRLLGTFQPGCQRSLRESNPSFSGDDRI